MIVRSPIKMLAFVALGGLSVTLAAGCSSAADEKTGQSDDSLRNCRMYPDLCLPPDPPPPISPPPPPACVPITTCPVGYTCGTISNGCKGTLNCGACSAPTSCGGGGVPHQCGIATQLCSTFDGVQTALNAGGKYMDPGGVWPMRPVPASAPSTYILRQDAQLCLSSAQTDALSNVQRTLMNNGCSGPHYFEAHNTNGGFFDPNVPCDASSPWSCWSDKANGFLQLCPNNATVNSFVATIGYQNYGGQPSDMPGHVSDPTKWNYASAMPQAPANMEWVITWEDPHACSGGCMCDI